MRRKYISPEFKHNELDGTFNMTEIHSFFGSKMMDIDDVIVSSNGSVVYYQKSNGEQINLEIENTLPPKSYSMSSDKNTNSTLVLDETQSDFETRGNTKWTLTIKVKEVLRNIIFARIKSSRAFEGILNNRTKFNNVDLAIKDYIDSNLLDRYSFDGVRLYLLHKNLTEKNGTLQFQNKWNDKIESPFNIQKKVQSDLKFDESELKLSFAQDKSSDVANFDYYYELFFKKKDGEPFGSSVPALPIITGTIVIIPPPPPPPGDVGPSQKLKNDVNKEWRRIETEASILNAWLLRSPPPPKNFTEVIQFPFTALRKRDVFTLTVKDRTEITARSKVGISKTIKGLTYGNVSLTNTYLKKLKKIKVPGTLSTRDVIASFSKILKINISLKKLN